MADGSNGFDPEQLNKYLSELDAADDKLLSLKLEHLNNCKAPRARIKNLMKEARGAGLNMEAFRAVVAKHRSDRKIEQRLSELEADDAADYEEMLHALGEFGDTPLGEAALKRARPQDESLDTLRT
jgi:uncharacterized protein (UPF0335 family)